MPGDYKAFINGWKELHPDFKFILWDESNSPIEHPYLKTAQAIERFANISNYVRLFALKKYGGIYLDVDFKLLKPLHSFLNYECFLGIESNPIEEETRVNNAIMGAIKDCKFVNDCLDTLIADFDGTEEAHLSSPALVTNLLLRKGLTEHKYQILDNIHIFPSNTFYPIPWYKAYELDKVKDLDLTTSVGVHMWGRSWYTIDTLLKKIDFLSEQVAQQTSIIAKSNSGSTISDLPKTKEPKVSVSKQNCIWTNRSKNVSYIITALKEDRRDALFTITSLLNLVPSLRIIYAEQLALGESHDLEFSDVLRQLNVEYLPLQISEPSCFNKLWGWNCAIKNSNTDFVIVADYELVPDKNFLIKSIISLQEKKGNFYAHVGDHDAVTIKSVERFESTEITYVNDEVKDWYSSPFFIGFSKDDLVSNNGFYERVLPASVGFNVLSQLLESLSFNKRDYKGSFYYNKFQEEQYDYLFQESTIDQEYKWLIETKNVSFYSFNRRYNNIFGWGASNKYLSSDLNSKVEEINNVLSYAQHYEECLLERKKLVVAVTTYQRLDYLHDFFRTFLTTRNLFFEWEILVADDGSTDGTLEYLSKLQGFIPEITVISNNRSGVAHQTNTILDHLANSEFDYCFKCDDDLLFLTAGWDTAYIAAIEKTGQQHLCHYSGEWKQSELTDENEDLVAHSDLWGVQGAFFTLTPEIINSVGYFDEISFGLRGWAHIDYSIRCWRAGLAGETTVMDIKNSNDYIILNYDPFEYKSSITIGTVYDLVDHHKADEKKDIVADENRVWLPYIPSHNVYDKDYLLELHKSALNKQNEELKSLKYANTLKEEKIKELEEALEEVYYVLAENQRLKIKIDQVRQELANAASVEADLNRRLSESYQKQDFFYKSSCELKELLVQEENSKVIIQDWYLKEYEVLPLWFKRLGHLIKILKGKRPLFKKQLHV